MFLCPYCGNHAKLVTGEAIYPHRDDLHDLNFWLCKECDAYVGCHEARYKQGDGTVPLGRLANAKLRAAKSNAHLWFDRLWKGQRDRNARSNAYRDLAFHMKLSKDDCHIGLFSEEQCAIVEEYAMRKLHERIRQAKRKA